MSDITLREFFAAHALQGLLASGHYTMTYPARPHGGEMPDYIEQTDEWENGGSETRAVAANHAWIIADHMLDNINREIPECSP